MTFLLVGNVVRTPEPRKSEHSDMSWPTVAALSMDDVVWFCDQKMFQCPKCRSNGLVSIAVDA